MSLLSKLFVFSLLFTSTASLAQDAGSLRAKGSTGPDQLKESIIREVAPKKLLVRCARWPLRDELGPRVPETPSRPPKSGQKSAQAGIGQKSAQVAKNCAG